MKTKDIGTIGATAFATAVITMAVFHTGSIDAGSDTVAPPPKIEQPKFVSHGIEFTLKTAGGQSFKTGDKPAFELEAVNRTSQTAGCDLWLTMAGMPAPNPMSRMVPITTDLWREKETFTLKAGERKTLSVSTDTKLLPGMMFSVSLNDKEPAKLWTPVTQPPNSVVALTFSTATNVVWMPGFVAVPTASVEIPKAVLKVSKP